MTSLSYVGYVRPYGTTLVDARSREVEIDKWEVKVW